MFNTAPGYKKYQAFCSTIHDEGTEDEPTLLAQLHIVNNDEEDTRDRDYEGVDINKEDFWVSMRTTMKVGDNVS